MGKTKELTLNGGLYPPRLMNPAIGLIERILPSNRPVSESSTGRATIEVDISLTPLPERPLSRKEQIIRFAVSAALIDKKWKLRPRFAGSVEEILDDAHELFIPRLPEAFFNRVEIEETVLHIEPK
jgi:hypothetical protein